jgi:tetratricopeptide (TPR) repeat protein
MNSIRVALPAVRAGLFVSLLPFLTAISYAQAPVWPLDGAAFTASPQQMLAAAGRVPAEKFAETTVLFEEEKNVMDGAGKVTKTHRLVYRIETQAGVEGWSEASVEWEAFYEKEPTIRARVIRPDGSVAELDPKTVTDGPARDEEEGTYSDERLHKAPLPALSAGVIVDEMTVLEDKEAYFSGGGVYRNYFQRSVPVVRSRLVVEAPTELPLQYRVSNLPNVAVTKEEDGGVQRLTFDQGYLAPLVNSDIDLPTRVPRAPRVEIATGKSWEAVAEIYRQLAEPQIQPDRVKGLLGAASGSTVTQHRMALIQAVVSRLHSEIRYTGIEFGESKLKPQTPAEILKRHYGDCKDKASLLVAMLRASGIQANLALLDAGPGGDVTPDMPGMNQFDHAIVYVPPASSTDKPLWIDATAEFTRVGELPYMDQGRMALVIAEGTHELTPTSQAQPEDSVLMETREFLLSDYGPAHVIETSLTAGHIDAAFRADYGEALNKQQQTSLENYAKNAYVVKAPPRVEHGDAKDFVKPFYLRLDMAKASRGSTDIKDAAVAVYPTGAYTNLPRWFSIDPDAGSAKLSEDEKADRLKAQAQRTTEYDIEPFIAERRYRITPPAGFVLRALPADKTTQMGPATLSQAYSVDATGVITANLRFNSGKGHYSAEEALALRKAVIEADKEDAVTILFDQAGSKLMAKGKVRDALAADRSLAEARPKDALPRVRLANAFLDAGLGDMARTEAILATKLDAKSAVAFNALGWVLQFNEIGVHFGKGFDLNRAIEAYKKSKQLDPEDVGTRSNLGILYEYDGHGARYASVAGIKSAIQEFRELAQMDKPTGERYEDNILFDLLYSHQYKELLAEIAPLPSTPIRDGLAISATAAMDGAEAGIKRADRVGGDAGARSAALRNAGAQLVDLRMYAQAADILSVGIQGQENAAQVARQIELFRSLKVFDPMTIAENTPEGVVERLLESTLTGRLTKDVIAELLSRHSFATDKEWQKNLGKSEESADGIQTAAERSGLPAAVLADLTLGTMKVSSKGDDATGYRVMVQTVGSAGKQFFVSKEDGQYKIVASKDDMTEVGTAALYLLRHGDEAGARSLLDWKRELMHRGGGDDQLEGPLLPRFWTAGESKGEASIEMASAALLTGSEEIAALLPQISSRRDKWASGEGKPERTDMNLLLAEGYLRVGDGAKARKAGDALLAEYPDSATAMRLIGMADSMNRDWTHWNSMLDAALAKHPTDRDLLSGKAWAEQAQGDFAGARKTLRQVLDAGQATGNDYNNYSWNALFQDKVDADAIQAAQQANMLSKNSSFAELHTLSCLYAAQGKTTEAKQVLFEAMAAANLGQPNSSAWFAFGAIFEQYGVLDAAIAAYKKVERPEGPITPTDTYVLAQNHLKALHAGE